MRISRLSDPLPLKSWASKNSPLRFLSFGPRWLFLPSVRSILLTHQVAYTDETFAVAAPIALGLESNGLGGYLDVQNFSGAVMIGGTICMLLLRGRRVSKMVSFETQRSRSVAKEAVRIYKMQAWRTRLWIGVKNIFAWKKV